MEKNVGNYQILESIGKGGMGEVFLAHDSVCGRNVAFKQMREQWADNVIMQERFLREARIASQLSHPSIIPIYSIDEKGTYYTMPHIEGKTLKAILNKTKQQAKKRRAPSPYRLFYPFFGADFSKRLRSDSLHSCTRGAPPRFKA